MSRPFVLLTLALTLCACGIIVFRVWGSTHGFISSDSGHYLRLAQTILDGAGFNVPNEGRGQIGTTHFSIWPVGYPLTIAGVASITGLEPFWASKALNLLALFLSVFMVLRGVRYGALAALALLFAAPVEIATYTWSEALFIPALVGLALSIGQVLSGKGPRWIIATGAAALALFMLRYAGLFALAPMGVTALALVWQGRPKTAAIMAGTMAGVAAVAVLYLHLNASLNGSATGMPRIPAPETHGELAVQFAVTITREAVPFLTVWKPDALWQTALVAIALFGSVLVAFKGRRPNKQAGNATQLAFVLVGLCYLLAIAVLRWRTHFDPFNLRLLAPGAVLIWIGLLDWAAGYIRPKPLYGWVAGLVLLSLGLQAGDALQGHSTAIDARHAMARTSLTEVPGGAIVLFGSPQTMFLRPDLHVALPRFRPLHDHDEDWQTFLDALDPKAPLWIEIGPKPDLRFGPDVTEALTQLRQRLGAGLHELPNFSRLELSPKRE